MSEPIHITLEDMQSLQEGALTLRANDQEWPAVMNELEALPQHNPQGARSPFTFCLQIEQSGLLQGTYSLCHPSLAEPLFLFLVPVAGDDSHTKLQAIFN